MPEINRTNAGQPVQRGEVEDHKESPDQPVKGRMKGLSLDVEAAEGEKHIQKEAGKKSSISTGAEKSIEQIKEMLTGSKGFENSVLSAGKKPQDLQVSVPNPQSNLLQESVIGEDSHAQFGLILGEAAENGETAFGLENAEDVEALDRATVSVAQPDQLKERFKKHSRLRLWASRFRQAIRSLLIGDASNVKGKDFKEIPAKLVKVLAEGTTLKESVNSYNFKRAQLLDAHKIFEQKERDSLKDELVALSHTIIEEAGRLVDDADALLNHDLLEIDDQNTATAIKRVLKDCIGFDPNRLKADVSQQVSSLEDGRDSESASAQLVTDDGLIPMEDLPPPPPELYEEAKDMGAVQIMPPPPDSEDESGRSINKP
ncbi:hypothetical protein [Kistimonas asteriae]|uniref:hypothetical protein n=1 Tax=Kistimonas asteriae TaxID=517724 RepID=UPI001BA99242|nr:hypothetical protein [Kistimonas asteriae]